MKKRSVIFSLPLFLLLLTGCPDKPDKIDGVALGDLVEANINAIPFTSVSVNQSYSTTSNPTQITITANGPNGGQYIVLAIKNFDKYNPKGTYSIGTSSSSAAIAALHNPNAAADEIALNGQFIIDGFSITGIHGTFNFNTQFSQVTNGSINLFLK